jgi:hypothetical protein
MPAGMKSVALVKVRPLLQAFDIGGDVAEFDERLSNYFVETSSFRDIVMDKADLILGAKGSGKSAIFKHLANRDADIPELNDVDVIPAFNVQGSVIFRRLSEAPPVSEPAYRFIWFTYIVAMISNHLLDSYDDVLDLSRLAKLIDAADLRVGPPFPVRLWNKIETIISSISKRLELEGELEFGIPKLPIKAKGIGRLRPRDVINEASDDQVDLEEVLFICADHLARLKRRCWLVFDRLDEAFEHSRELENTVLRGLMRAHLDVASYGSSIRTKLFLRNDIMDRVVQSQGFVNATHLRRLNLQWDEEGIIDLLARRIASNEGIVEGFDVRPDNLKSTPGRLATCHLILPSHLYSVPLPEWIHRFTADSTKALNPRNALTLVNLARQYQLDIYDRDDPDLGSVSSLISQKAVLGGFWSLSEKRLEDTVYAEFNSLRPVVETLRGKPVRFTHKELSRYIKAAPDSDDFRISLEGLEYAGIVSVNGQDVITVAPLYRPALGISLGRHSGITSAEAWSLKEKVDLAIQTWPQGDASVAFPDMSMQERHFIHNYVEERYPNYSTVSSSSGKLPELKSLIIRDRRLSISAVSSPNPSMAKLQGRRREDKELLVGLRAEAAKTDYYFIGSPVGFSTALSLVELDRSTRRNKARRRIVGFLAEGPHNDSPENGQVRPILGSCHAWIIDPSRGREHLTAELQELIIEMIISLCAIAASKRRAVIVTFACPAVKSFAMSAATQCSTVKFVEDAGAIMDSRLTAILQPH